MSKVVKLLSKTYCTTYVKIELLHFCLFTTRGQTAPNQLFPLPWWGVHLNMWFRGLKESWKGSRHHWEYFREILQFLEGSSIGFMRVLRVPNVPTVPGGIPVVLKEVPGFSRVKTSHGSWRYFKNCSVFQGSFRVSWRVFSGCLRGFLEEISRIAAVLDEVWWSFYVFSRVFSQSFRGPSVSLVSSTIFWGGSISLWKNPCWGSRLIRF